MEASLRAAGSRGPGSTVRFFMLSGIAAGGVLGVPLCVGIELGSIVLSYGGIDFSEGEMATLVWLLFLVDLSFRGFVFGLMIGPLAAVAALLARQRLRSAGRTARAVGIGIVSGLTSGALAWAPAHAVARFMTTADEMTYAVGAAVVGGLVAAATEYLFVSSARDENRPVR